MALRLLAASLILAGLTDGAFAQRGFRRGYYGPRGPAYRTAPTFRDLPGTMPYYPPYLPTYGGRFAPVQYFTPPVIINGFLPNGVYSINRFRYSSPYGYGYGYGSQYGQHQVITSGGLHMTGTPNLVKPPAPKAASQKPVEIEPEPVKIQQVAAGDKVASVRFQTQGDSLFQIGNYNRAFSAYKAAIQADSSRPEPYFRLAALFSAMRTYEPAVRYLKQGLDFAPGFAKDGDRLDAMYGPTRRDQKRSHVSNLVTWANQNQKSPDRQLLAGALLHFDDQQAAAAPFLERASQLSQRPGRATTLLSARDSGVLPPAPEPPGLLLLPEPETNPLPPPNLQIPGSATPPKLPKPNLDVPPDPVAGK